MEVSSSEFLSDVLLYTCQGKLKHILTYYIYVN